MQLDERGVRHDFGRAVAIAVERRIDIDVRARQHIGYRSGAACNRLVQRSVSFGFYQQCIVILRRNDEGSVPLVRRRSELRILRRLRMTRSVYRVRNFQHSALSPP